LFDEVGRVAVHGLLSLLHLLLEVLDFLGCRREVGRIGLLSQLLLKFLYPSVQRLKGLEQVHNGLLLRRVGLMKVGCVEAGLGLEHVLARAFQRGRGRFLVVEKLLPDLFCFSGYLSLLPGQFARVRGQTGGLLFGGHHIHITGLALRRLSGRLVRRRRIVPGPDPGRSSGRGGFHALLLFDETAYFRPRVEEIGELLFCLLESGNLIAELFVGLFERCYGRRLRLLRSAGALIIAAGEVLLGFVHLAGSLAGRLCRVGGDGGGVFLEFARPIFQSILARSEITELGGILLLGGGGLRFEIFLLFDQFPRALLEVAGGRQFIVYSFRRFGLGELILYGGTRPLQFRQSGLFVVKRLIPAFFQEIGARFLHFVHRLFQLFGDLRRNVLNVLAGQIGVIDDVRLSAFHLCEIALARVELLRLLDDALFGIDRALHLRQRLFQRRHGIFRRRYRPGQFAQLIVNALLRAGSPKEVGSLQVVNSLIQRRPEPAGLKLFHRRRQALARRAVGVARNSLEPRQHRVHFVPDSALLHGLKVERRALAVVETGAGTIADQPRQFHRRFEIQMLPPGQILQPQRYFVQRLLPLIFQQKLAELHDDVLLPGHGADYRAPGDVLVGSAAGVLKRGDDAPHLLFAEFVEDAAYGLKHLHIRSVEAIALELLDYGIELSGHLLGLVAYVLLAHLSLADGVRGRLLSQNDGADRCHCHRRKQIRYPGHGDLRRYNAHLPGGAKAPSAVHFFSSISPPSCWLSFS